MNRWKPIAALVFCGTLVAAHSGYAQDDGGFGGGFGGGGFGGFDGGGGGGRGGGQPQQQQQNQRVATTLLQANAPESLMTLLKSALERNGAPKLSKDQEKDVTAFLTKEAKTALADIEAKAKAEGLNLPNAQAAAGPPLTKSGAEVVQLFLELNSGRGNNNNNNNRNINQGNRGNRGGGNNNGNNNNNNNRLNAQVLRPAEDAFLMTLANAPVLNAKQKTAVLKWRNEVIRQRGGIEEFRVQMEEAGAPLTAEQVTQLRTVFEESDQKRTTLRNDLLQRVQDLQAPPEAPREGATTQNQNQNQNQNNNPLNQLQGLGRVDDAKVLALSTDMREKVKALEDDTNRKILRPLTEPQRMAFIKIEQERLTARQANIKQQREQILTRR